MKTVTYKGYQASVEYEDGSLFVKVLHLDDLLIAECASAAEVPQALADLVDAYLADCNELGKEPTKPFGGTFNVRVGAELHRMAAIAAAGDGRTLNSWVTKAIEDKLECTSLTDRVDGIIGARRAEIQAVRLAQSIGRATYSSRWPTKHTEMVDLSLVFAVESSPNEWTN